MKMKKILSILIFALMLTACGNTSEEAGGQSAEGGEEVVKSETYKHLYTSEDNVMYYGSEDEEVCSFTGYDELDTYFYHNVNYGEDASGNWVLIDVDGNNVIEPGTYDYMDRETEEYYTVEKETENDELCGVIDYQGNVIIPIEYEYIQCREAAAFGEDPCVTYFVAETKEGEYVVFGETGVELFRTTGEFSVYDVSVYEPYNENCVPTLEYQGTVYNMNDGTEILKIADGCTYAYNFYYNGDTNTLTIYDESFNVKEEITYLENVYSFEKTYKELFCVRAKDSYYFTPELTMEKIVVDTTHHVLANGEEYRSEIDAEAEEIHIYNAAGEEVCSPAYSDSEGRDVNQISAVGNYLVASCGSYNKGAIIDLNTGAYLMDGIVYEVYSPECGLLLATNTSGDETAYTVFHENFTMEMPVGAAAKMCENGFWVLDWEGSKAVFYDLNGVAQNEIAGITESIKLQDNYFLLTCEDGTGKMINQKDGSVTFTFETSKCNLDSLRYGVENNVGIIELEDGFYNYHGEKLVEKGTVQE